MITLITGAPGSGKTAALILLLQDVLRAAGRIVYVHGIPDLKIEHQQLVDPTTWPSSVPDGSVVIIDEVQNVWRPRGPGTKVPDHVAALETHRHRGLDFYIITQGPNLVDANVRALVGRHIHLRDIGFLGRWWYEWPECADQCRTGWKNAPIKKKYKLPKQIFGLYKSASVHIKPVRSFPKMFFVAVFALLAVAVLSYYAYSSLQAKLAPPAPVAVVGALPGFLQGSAPQAKHVLTPEEYFAAFVPRVEGLPHTAPRYDEVQKITQVPKPAACIDGIRRGETERSCICWSQQATPLQVPADMCRQIAAGGFFDDALPVDASAGRTALPPAVQGQGQAPLGGVHVVGAGGGYGLRDAATVTQRNGSVKAMPVGTLSPS